MAIDNDWSKWDSKVSPEMLEKLDNIEDGQIEYERVPPGTYEVVPEKIEMKTAKNSGNPMVSFWFKVVSEGDQKGRYLFANFVLHNDYGIYKCRKFLQGLDPECTSKFESYTQWAGLIDTYNEILSGNYSFVIEYSLNNKGFNEYKITQGAGDVPDGYTFQRDN